MTEGTLGTVQVKEEANNVSFCYGCLNSDRRLTVLSENTDLFVYLLGRSCVPEHTHISLCWECSAILRNTRRFQQRIRRAQYLMQLQQSLYQQQTSQTLIARDTIKLHSSLHTKIFDPDHYDFCIEHTDTLTDINMADTEIEIEELDHEESLYEEVQLKQENPIKLHSPHSTTSTRNDTVTYSNTDTTQSNDNNQSNKINNIESTVHSAVFKEQFTVQLERIDEEGNVQLKYENIYDSDIDIDEVVIEAGLDETEECSAQDTNIEHQLNKHDENLNEKGIDSDDCESNVSDGRFSEREMESSSEEATPRKKSKPSDDVTEPKTEEKIEVVMHANHILVKRLTTRTKDKPHECSFCKKTFLLNSELKLHLKTHTCSVKRLGCEMCDKRFKYKCELIRHLVTHTGERLFCCEVCGKKFTRNCVLKCHSKLHGEKYFSCELCDKRFINHYTLKRHYSIHTGEKRFSCGLCDKKFTESSSLKSHSRIHTGEKPYSCELCDKKFTSNGNLKKHSTVHTGERPYSCEICDKNFSHHSSLKIHSKLHTGVKLYKCDICCKRFMLKSHLKSHLRVHNKKKKLKNST